jgi:endonuclease-3
MFAWAEEGHRSLFDQLVACVLSVRTRDEVSLVSARRLFAAAPTPRALAALSLSRIDWLIGDVSFHGAKAGQIREIARRTVRDHAGTLPRSEAVLRSFQGVGREVGVTRHR